jgi:hypothetical protein
MAQTKIWLVETKLLSKLAKNYMYKFLRVKNLPEQKMSFNQNMIVELKRTYVELKRR